MKKARPVRKAGTSGRTTRMPSRCNGSWSKLTQAWGEGASWVLDGGDHPHEAHYLKLDCSKAKMRLDWHPRWHLEDALSAIVEWHRAHRDGKDMRELTLRQISAYGSSIQKH